MDIIKVSLHSIVFGHGSEWICMDFRFILGRIWEDVYGVWMDHGGFVDFARMFFDPGWILEKWVGLFG